MPLPGPAAALTGKVAVQRPSLPVLPRRRLTELIEQAARHRVIVVTGPAGAGKTVACAAWASARAGMTGTSGPARKRPVAWLTLDAGDRDPDQLWASLQASLAAAAAEMPGSAGMHRSGVMPGSAGKPGPAQEPRSARLDRPARRDRPAGRATAVRPLLDVQAGEDYPLRLAAAARQPAEPVTVVLDDMHELGGELPCRALPGLDQLIRHAPPSLRLVLAGRYAPPLARARLRVAGELADVGAPELACTAAEADAYFEMLGLRAPAAQRDELLRRTEGWMTGLRLITMRAVAAPLSPGSITRLAGNHRVIADYFRDEVLRSQPPQTQRLLLRTSVTPQVSGDLADAISGEPGSGRVLERLSRENSFVRPADPGDARGAADWYSCHPMLRSVLTAALRRESPAQIPVLAGRAARWFAGRGATLDAVRAAVQARDWDFAARVLAEAGPAALMTVDAAALRRALAEFPAQRAAADPAVAAAFAVAALRAGDAGAAGPVPGPGRTCPGRPGDAGPAGHRDVADRTAGISYGRPPRRGGQRAGQRVRAG